MPQLRMQHEAMLEAIQAVLEVSQPQVMAVIGASYRAASLICTALEVEKSNLMIYLIQKSNSEKSELFKKEKEKEKDERLSIEEVAYGEIGRVGDDRDKESEKEREKERQFERENDKERAVQAAAEELRETVYALTVSLSEVRTALRYTALPCVVLYFPVQYCSELDCIEFYYTVMYCTILYSSVLYRT